MGCSKVKLISMIAVAAMVMCAFLPIVNSNALEEDHSANTQTVTSSDEKQGFRYVSLGDSMTTGFGISYDGMNDDEEFIGYYSVIGSVLNNPRGFLKEVNGTYATRIAEYLGNYYDVDHAQLGISGLRSVDIRALIYNDSFTGSDEYPGDRCTADRFFKSSTYDNIYRQAILGYPALAEEHGLTGATVFDDKTRAYAFDLLNEIYTTELSSADLVTYNSMCNFAHALKEISDLVKGDESLWNDFDFSLYMDEDYVELAYSVQSSVSSFITGAIAEYLEGMEESVIKKYVDMAFAVSNILTYTVVSYCADYDAIMKYIDEHNDGAQVIIIDPYNQFESLSVEIYDYKISVSEIYDHILGRLSSYTALSDLIHCYKNIEINHVTMDLVTYEGLRTFGDEFVCGEPTDDSKAALMYAVKDTMDPDFELDSTVKIELLKESYNNIDGEYGHLTEFMQIVLDTTNVEIMSLLSVDMAQIVTNLSDALALLSLEDTAVERTSAGCMISGYTLKGHMEVTFTEAEMFIMFVIFTIINGDGILYHLNANGHEAIFDAVSEVIDIEA